MALSALQSGLPDGYREMELVGLAALPFRTLTFPSYQSHLTRSGTEGWIALGVEKDGVPVGLGLAQAGRSERFAGDILSLGVAPEHRRQGIGASLLRGLETRLEAAGARFACLRYMTGQKSTPAVTAMLQSAGWQPPVRRQLFGESNFAEINKAPWMRFCTFPPDFEVFAWPGDLQPSERKMLQQNEGDANWYPELLNPLHEETDIDGENSRGLRHRGRLVGWIVAFRLAPHKIRYQKLFVRAEFQRRGMAIRLLAHSIAGLPPSGVTEAVWDVIPGSEAMLAFFERGLLPYCTSHKWSMGAIKPFSIEI